MTKSIFELKLRATEPLANKLLDMVAAAGSSDDQLWVLWRCASAIAVELDENEIQAHLCDLYLWIEVAAQRATLDDSAWVQPNINRYGFDRGGEADS